LVVTLMSAGLFLSAIVPGFNPAKERLILNAVMNYLDALHLDPVNLDDNFSEQAFDNYLEMVDPGKRFLVQTEIDLLSQFRFDLDEQVAKRSFEFFNESVEVINNSRERAKRLFEVAIESDMSDLESESLEMDVDKRYFAQNEEALQLLWRKVIKYDFNNRLKSKIENQNKKLEPASDVEIEADEEDKKVEVYVEKSIDELKSDVKEAINKSYKNWFDNMDKGRRSDKFEIYVNAITHLFDPHSDYLNPKAKKDFDIQMGGKLEGIGARLSTEDDMTKVVSIVPGGPAWKGKSLEEGDLISAVTQKGEEAVNIVGMRLDDVVQMIRGNKGTHVILTVKKVDGNVEDIEIERDEVIIDEAFARSLILDVPNTIENVGYIRLPKFYSSFEKEDGNSCAKDVKIEIEKLNDKNINGIILDLRSNGGGSLKDVIDMTGLFIEDGPIVQVKPRNKEAYVYDDEDESVHYTGPLVVMVNQFSASASEILAAALQDYNRAIIVGSNSTFGKGTVQRFIDLDRAYRDYEEIKPLGNLKITMQKFYRIDGGSTQLKGVVPDIILPDNYHYLKTGERDYENALDWTEISPVEFDQQVYPLTNLDHVVTSSSDRIESSETFKMILKNAERLKRNQDDSEYPLGFEAFSKLRDNRRTEAEKFADLYDVDIEDLKANNLDVDIDYINVDESRVARNEDWIKSIKKDIYIEEVMYILKDMVNEHKDLAQRK